mgnify:CR=1 FL=1
MKPIYSSFGLADRSTNPSTGVWLPVSLTLANHRWVTVPWDVDYSDPENQHSGPGAWTVLHGPALFEMTAGIRLLNQHRQASCHIRLWAGQFIDGVDTRLSTNFGESWEHFVGDEESNQSHVNGTWRGWLPADQRLRVEVDYWKAGLSSSGGARIIGGSARLFVWR